MGTAGVSAGGGGGGVGDFTSATFDSAFSSTAITNLRGLVVSSDETKMLIIDSSATTNYLTRLEMSTAGDLSTISIANTSSIGTGSKQNLFMQSPSIIWALDATNDNVKKYTLNADFGNTVSSTDTYAVIAGVNTTGADNPNAVTFNNDGTKMYILDLNADGLQEFALSTAYDPSTATYTTNGSVSSQTTSPLRTDFNSDGTKFYIVAGFSGSVLYQYSLSTAFDVSTLSYDGSLSLTDGALSSAFAAGIHITDDDSTLYVSAVDFTAGTYLIGKYTTGTSSPSWTDPDIANASYDTVSFSVSTQEPAPSGIFFKPDGTKMYICGTTGSSSQKVNEYDLSTAWDPSTATHNQGLNVSTLGASEATPQGIFFKDDGTKMFIVGNTGDAVHEYTLSTAWDISSASFVDSTSTSTQTTNPVSLFFKADGTKLYTINLFTSQVYQYDLSTAWDASTMSYNNVSFDLDAPVNASSAKEISFNPDGTKMWAIFDGGDRIAEYDLSTAWDVSSASYNSTVGVVSFSQETTPRSLFFKSDGSKMYIVGTASDTVYQYST
jgi:hypothetical protein